MDEVLHDTDILSEILKGFDPKVVAKASSYLSSFHHFLISIITVVEVVRGLHKRGREGEIRLFLSMPSIRPMPFDLRAAELAGRLDADLERAGQPIGRADPQY